MSERIPVHAYREMMGVKSPSASPRKGGIPQALGRLKQGEMNKTEMRYSDHLDWRKLAGEIVWFAFEPITIRLAPKTSITPDFMLMRRGGELEIHDAKGTRKIYTDDAKAKMKIAATLLPIPFFVCFPRSAKQGGGWDVEAV